MVKECGLKVVVEKLMGRYIDITWEEKYKQIETTLIVDLKTTLHQNVNVLRIIR